MNPYYKGFKGSIIKLSDTQYISKGNYSIDEDRLVITELPIGEVFEVLRTLPKYGLGERVQRQKWGETCFWTVTDVKAKPHGGGKVWGRLTWDGVEKAAPEQIPGRVKRVWRALGERGTSGWKPEAALEEALSKGG